MIQELVNKYMANKHHIEAAFTEKHPDSYADLVRIVVSAITAENDYEDLNLDPERIHQIDDGDYQGTLLFVIAAKGYQPDDYWFVKVNYGSCGGCDTLQGIRENSTDDSANARAIAAYMQLALHIVQGIKPMQEDFI